MIANDDEISNMDRLLCLQYGANQCARQLLARINSGNQAAKLLGNLIAEVTPLQQQEQGGNFEQTGNTLMDLMVMPEQLSDFARSTMKRSSQLRGLSSGNANVNSEQLTSESVQGGAKRVTFTPRLGRR